MLYQLTNLNQKDTFYFSSTLKSLIEQFPCSLFFSMLSGINLDFLLYFDKVVDIIDFELKLFNQKRFECKIHNLNN